MRSMMTTTWDEWKDMASGETLKSCTMTIIGPNKFVAEVHDRMPVWPVSKRVNSSRERDDDPT